MFLTPNDISVSDRLAISAQIEFFAPFVLTALLRSGPIEGDELNSLFVTTMESCLPNLKEGALQCGMWAIYFWIKHGLQWRFLTEKLLQSLAHKVVTEDEIVVKLLLWIWSYFWLIPSEKSSRKIIQWLRCYFPLQQVADLMFCGVESVAEMSVFLLSNFTAFDSTNFEDFFDGDGFQRCSELLVNGSASLKKESAHLICVFLLKCENDVLTERVSAELIEEISEIVKMDESEVEFFVSVMVELRRFDWILDVLCECKFMEFLEEMSELSRNLKFLHGLLMERSAVFDGT
jgi:hypothetical protein